MAYATIYRKVRRNHLRRRRWDQNGASRSTAAEFLEDPERTPNPIGLAN